MSLDSRTLQMGPQQTSDAGLGGLRDGVALKHRVIIITQTAAIALEPLTTHPDEWAEPSNTE